MYCVWVARFGLGRPADMPKKKGGGGKKKGGGKKAKKPQLLTSEADLAPFGFRVSCPLVYVYVVPETVTSM